VKAADLAANGSYKNSGQRCTAVKRILVHEKVAAEFTDALLAKTRAWSYGDPLDPPVDMGTVIDAGRGQPLRSAGQRRGRRRRAAAARQPALRARRIRRR
jgi:acyl-CoA reductase-like NAD-dependent aldehyde dehydrogenase